MSQFLPTFDIAPAHNRRIVTGLQNGSDAIEFTGDRPCAGDRLFAQMGLANKQLIARYLGEISCDVSGEPLETYGWDELTSQTYSWLDSHISKYPFEEYQNLGFATEAQAKKHILAAGYMGIATASAFLEVIPRVLSEQELEKPNADIADYGRRSKGFIVEWMGLNDDVDYHLAYALALKKPLHKEQLFEGLRFKRRWFCAENGRVRIDASKVANLRDMSNSRHPASHQPRVAVLLGCPARKMMPRIYDAMVNQAEGNSLFEMVYRDERRKYGLTCT